MPGAQEDSIWVFGGSGGDHQLNWVDQVAQRRGRSGLLPNERPACPELPGDLVGASPEPVVSASRLPARNLR